MPRRGQVKEKSGERLVDRVGLGVIAVQFPDVLIERVIEETGRREQRSRDLPAALMARYVIALALFPADGYDEVMRLVKVADDWLGGGRGPAKVPATTAITAARDRLGVEPVKRLFEHVAHPLAIAGRTPDAFYRGRRIAAIDHTTLLVPDSPENASAFGPPPGEGPHHSLPEIRVLGLVECGTAALLAAAFGGKGGTRARESPDLLPDVLPAMGAGMLVLAELGIDMFSMCARTGADLLWRVRTDDLSIESTLADGSALSYVRQPAGSPARQPTGSHVRQPAGSHARQPAGRGGGPRVPIRVIDYADAEPVRLRHLPAQRRVPDRLLTTLLDPVEAPAAELIDLYRRRCPTGRILDEIRTHQQATNLILRSRAPARVEQEVWGILALHRALRHLIHQATTLSPIMAPQPSRRS